MTLNDPLRAWARDLLARQPSTPRSVALLPSLRQAYHRESIVLHLVLAAFGVAAFTAFTVAPGDGPWRILGQFIAAGFVGWTLGRPLLIGLRLRRSLATGSRRTATVQEVVFTPARDAGASIESMRNGIATGRWAIENNGDDHIVADFTTDAPWAGLLQPGTVLEVLVADDEVLDVGITVPPHQTE